MKVNLHEPSFGEDEIQAAVDVLRSGRVTSGDKVRKFESKFGEHAVMVNSGSSANLLVLAAITNPAYPNYLQPGDEVIVSALSWSTTVWPIIQCGLIPVIVDIDPKTLNIDPEQIRKAIGPHTRAIMPVHVYGNPCDMPEIKKIAAQFDLILIEDCCEALGAEVGKHGDFATYSFYFSHHITTLEGGMVVCHDEQTADLLCVLRNHGWTRDMRGPKPVYPGIDEKFTFINLGYNLRASELNAAIGLVQIEKLADFVEARRNAASIIKMMIDGKARTQKDNGSSWFGFPIVEYGMLRQRFEEAGVETRPIICGNISRQPAMNMYEHRVVGDLHHADVIMDKGFAIPCHQSMDMEDLILIGSIIKDYYA